MNSEELELSLRSEFESYLKNVLAEMRQDAMEFQTRIEAELDKQKALFDNAFQDFSARFDADRTFDEAFAGSVAEHLSLARDNGAKIAANAMVEAEKLAPAAAPGAVPVETKYDAIRDAVDDIGGMDSQSAILKSLVHHATEFAPRGAFFIIKSEHFVGWKVFGAEDEVAETTIRDIHFPTSADSILGQAFMAKSSIDGSADANPKDSAFLEPLQFGQPDSMFAIPLIARGRAVAVLYADNGSEGGSINREALETLVRVAGLTVELLATMQTAKAENREVAAADFEDAQELRDFSSDARQESPEYVSETLEDTQIGEDLEKYFETPVEAESGFDDEAQEVPSSFVQADEHAEFTFRDKVELAGGVPQSDADAADTFEANPFEAEAAVGGEYDTFEDAERPPQLPDEPYAEVPQNKPIFGDESLHHFDPIGKVEPPAQDFSSPAATFGSDANDEEETGGEMVFDAGSSIEQDRAVSSPFDSPTDRYEPAIAASSSGFGQIADPVIEAPIAQISQPRLSDRPVDLPIEVPEDERRIHNDARRFARLLVSEIKLYNEKKVIEGRESQDLYERLKEAIDRSREMYDKRVQPPVAAKFDYFHYELLNALAEGNVERLGSGYPGSNV